MDPVLSNEDRQRIREEIIFRNEVRNELKLSRTAAPGSWSRRAKYLFEILNKPVFITLIFSLAAGLITIKVQNNAALKEQQRVHSQALRERKLQLLATFDAAFNKSFLSITWYTQKRDWILSFNDVNLHPKGPASFPGGIVEYNKMIDGLEQNWKEISALPTYDGLFMQIESLFDSAEVQRRLKELRENVIASQQMPHSSAADIANIQNSVQPKVQNLLRAMGQEIKNMKSE